MDIKQNLMSAKSDKMNGKIYFVHNDLTTSTFLCFEPLSNNN